MVLLLVLLLLLANNAAGLGGCWAGGAFVVHVVGRGGCRPEVRHTGGAAAGGPQLAAGDMRRSGGPADPQRLAVTLPCPAPPHPFPSILSSFFYKYADTILKKYSSTIATIFTGAPAAGP